MSGTPDRSTLMKMIVLALVAMAIKLFALANAKTQYFRKCLLIPVQRSPITRNDD